MNGQDQRRIFRDHQRLGRDIHALLADRGDLTHQMPRVQHDAIADDAELATTHHARGQRVQLVDLPVDDQRVARIMATLEARDHIGTFRQPIDDLAFAFIAPLGPDNNDISHGRSSGCDPGGL